MAKNYIKPDPDKQLNRRLRAALGSILLDQAEGFMTEEELANSCAYCSLCSYDAQCEEIFMTLCRELGNQPQQQ